MCYQLETRLISRSELRSFNLPNCGKNQACTMVVLFKRLDTVLIRKFTSFILQQKERKKLYSCSELPDSECLSLDDYSPRARYLLCIYLLFSLIWTLCIAQYVSSLNTDIRGRGGGGCGERESPSLPIVEVKYLFDLTCMSCQG